MNKCRIWTAYQELYMEDGKGTIQDIIYDMRRDLDFQKEKQNKT